MNSTPKNKPIGEPGSLRRVIGAGIVKGCPNGVQNVIGHSPGRGPQSPRSRLPTMSLLWTATKIAKPCNLRKMSETQPPVPRFHPSRSTVPGFKTPASSFSPSLPGLQRPERTFKFARFFDERRGFPRTSHNFLHKQMFSARRPGVASSRSRPAPLLATTIRGVTD